MLLDTCVVIDLLRGRQGAADFIDGLGDTPALSAITGAELVAGLRGVAERRRIDRIFATYAIHDIDFGIAALAGDYVLQFGPSHAVDPLDALIAATATVHRVQLATLNLRRFPMFSGLRRPYIL